MSNGKFFKIKKTKQVIINLKKNQKVKKRKHIEFYKMQINLW
jgi:hypothetical protein